MICKSILNCYCSQLTGHIQNPPSQIREPLLTENRESSVKVRGIRDSEKQKNTNLKNVKII